MTTPDQPTAARPTTDELPGRVATVKLQALHSYKITALSDVIEIRIDGGDPQPGGQPFILRLPIAEALTLGVDLANVARWAAVRPGSAT